MTKIILITILNGFIFALYCYLMSLIILEKKQKNIKTIIYALLPFLLMYYCILCLLESVYAIFFSGLCAFFFIKIMFKESNYMSLFISLFVHTMKIMLKILILGIINNKTLLLVNTYKSLTWLALCLNLVAIILSLIIVFFLRKQIIKLVKYISNKKNRQYVLLIITYIDFIAILLCNPPNNLYSISTITDFIMIFVVTHIGIFNITSEQKMESVTKYYKDIFEYSKANEELLNKYKMQVHENKNKLLMIKGMLGGPKKNIEKYINSLLKEISENKSNYWLTELRYIPIAGFRNFINYKLIKLKKLGAEIEVFVDSELGKLEETELSEKEYNQLSTILGVVLDNMIESIKESKEKLISINIYIDDDKIRGEFVNTYSGKIDLDRLYELGYTTKGAQHGVGLPLVYKITKMNKRFECKPEIIDNFFVQHISIRMYDNKNIQKTTEN